MYHTWVANHCFSNILQINKLMSSLVLAFVFFPLQSLAAPPAPFDAWVSQNGRIVVPCPGGFTCDDNVADTGILQRTLLDNNGRRFVQLILQDGAINGLGQMTLESFIDASNANREGISARQSIVENGTNNVNYTVDINTGWADSPGSPTINLGQTISDTTAQGVGFNQSFNLQAHQDANENVTGYRFDIRQEVTNSAILNGINSTGTDLHVFVLRRVGGSMLTAGGTASLPAAAGGMGMGGAAGGMGGGAAAPAPAPAPPAVGPAPTPVAGGPAPVAGTPAPVAPAPVAPAPAPGGGTMGMSVRSNSNNSGVIPSQAGATQATTLASRNNSLASGFVSTLGTTTGAGASPCPTDGAPPGTGDGRTTGDPPGCSSNVGPPNPGSTGTGGGGLAAAPAGTLAPGPRPGTPGGFVGNPAGMGGGGPAGGSISWSAGQEIQVIWIGQICQGCQTVAGMGGMGAGTGGNFSFQAYENLSSGAPAIVTRSILQANPFNWAAPFGPAPGL